MEFSAMKTRQPPRQLLTMALAILDLIKPHGLSFVWQKFASILGSANISQGHNG
jgi:hypothetical protein